MDPVPWPLSRDVFDCFISSPARSRTSFGLSLLFHGGCVAALVATGASSLGTVPSLRLPKPYVRLMLASPPTARPEPAVVVRAPRTPAPVLTPRPLFRPPLPVERVEKAKPVLEPSAAPELYVQPSRVEAAPQAAMVERPPADPPRPAVQTGVFAYSPAPEAPAARAAGSVHTGAFEAAGLPEPSRPVGRMLARIGAFESASVENGSPHRAAEAVARAGFSGVSAAPDPDAPVVRTGVRSGGFGDASVEAPAASRARPSAAKAAATGVRILFEPHPAYTAEARRFRTEGEVLLDVLFSASGEVRVLRVVKRLGHGLDETAVEAAQKIRFRPAQAGGRPVDSTATVHITFQLAY